MRSYQVHCTSSRICVRAAERTLACSSQRIDARAERPRTRSRRPAKSTSTASSAVGIAPASIMPGSFRSMPVKISSPRPPPPIRNASGAVPTLIASAVRMPANDHEQRVGQLDAAPGSAWAACPCRRPPRRSTPARRACRRRCCARSAAATRPTSAKIAGTTPMPSRLIASASTASVGIVLPRLSACMMRFGQAPHARPAEPQPERHADEDGEPARDRDQLHVLLRQERRCRSGTWRSASNRPLRCASTPSANVARNASASDQCATESRQGACASARPARRRRDTCRRAGA